MHFTPDFPPGPQGEAAIAGYCEILFASLMLALREGHRITIGPIPEQRPGEPLKPFTATAIVWPRQRS
jgi:hypothetical protein